MYDFTESMTLAEMTKIRFDLIHIKYIALNVKEGIGQWPKIWALLTCNLAWGLGTPGWPHPHPVPVPERQKWLLYQAHDNYSG